jgi:hypothetical protein
VYRQCRVFKGFSNDQRRVRVVKPVGDGLGVSDFVVGRSSSSAFRRLALRGYSDERVWIQTGVRSVIKLNQNIFDAVDLSMAHGAAMFSNGSRTRRGAASKDDNHQISARASRAASNKVAATEAAGPPFGLIEGGLRRL